MDFGRVLSSIVYELNTGGLDLQCGSSGCSMKTVALASPSYTGTVTVNKMPGSMLIDLKIGTCILYTTFDRVVISTGKRVYTGTCEEVKRKVSRLPWALDVVKFYESEVFYAGTH